MTLDLSVVMPCLNEAETLEHCILEANAALERAQLRGEIVVADNGSVDGSQAIASGLGARVVHVSEKGYGSALRGGILAARAPLVVMGDADGSYDFSAIPAFRDKLREGYDFVVGNRFQGGIMPGAMPALHRWLGNPVLSFLGRLFFRSRVGDFHCGIRGFRRDAYLGLRLQTTGMEFASEMIIMASLAGLRIAEIPVGLRPDGRSRKPHLRTWRDGWRHLRFMLLYSPRWLFLLPGIAMMALGLAGAVRLTLGPLQIGSVNLGIHTLLLCGLIVIAGYQVIVFGIFTRTFAATEGIYPESGWFSWLQRYVTLEMGLLVGLCMLLGGAAAVLVTFFSWESVGFERLDPVVTMRQMIPAGVLLVLGTQTIFSSFFLSILGLRRAPDADLLDRETPTDRRVPPAS
ncbi:MAG: glycosyltransferase family 2 protein [Candidatus Dormibacteraeota bacterium]|nr:glycosyltransferase family 2 protein [Candidatus Dormibacteraeota bacterium]